MSPLQRKVCSLNLDNFVKLRHCYSHVIQLGFPWLSRVFYFILGLALNLSAFSGAVTSPYIVFLS